MVHNYDINKGIYPDEPGYKEWTGFEEQCKIPGNTFKKYRPIHPLKFHEELLKKMFDDIPLLLNKNSFEKTKWEMEKNSKIILSSEKNNFLVKNFYQTCCISRASENMANCVKEILEVKKGK